MTRLTVAQLGSGIRRIPTGGYGGVERTIWDLHQALIASGVDSVLLNPYDPENRRHEWRYARRAHLALRGVSADILHIHHERTGCLLGLRGVPYVLESHTPTWTDPPWPRKVPGQTYNRLWNRLLFTPEKLGVAMARGTIAHTEAQVEGLRRRIPFPLAGPIRRIPIGIDAERFKAHGIGDPNVVLGVGLVSPRKRWELAGRALRDTGMTLRVVGPASGPLVSPSYVRKVKESGPVKLLGEVSEEQLLKEFENASILVHPSSGESLGMVIIQALSFSRPVITSNMVSQWVGFPGCRTYGNHLDAPGFVRFIRREATRLREDDVTRLMTGWAGRDHIEANYAWPRVVEQYLGFYRDVLARRGWRPFLTGKPAGEGEIKPWAGSLPGTCRPRG